MVACAVLALAGCTSVPESRPPTPLKPAPADARQPQFQFKEIAWKDLPGWQESDLAGVWGAFVRGCAVAGAASPLSIVCGHAARAPDVSPRAFFEAWFTPHRISDQSGAESGLLTGYYEPTLRGSRTPSAQSAHPVYGVPRDLLQIDLARQYPDLAHHRLRGRVEGRKVVPYHDRAAIETSPSPLAGQELLWVDDPVALFFLHIQGSGKVTLDGGTRVRLGYADQNGHPYKAIGKVLVERGEMRVEEVSLQSIRAWLLNHPEQASAVMAQNASYVFFEERPDSEEGPRGTQGVALTPGYSIAVDARVIPLGSPVYIASTWPDGTDPLRRLTMAQDTGGAIRGAVRADLFLGEGHQAEERAGRMRQSLRAWILLPRNGSR